MKNMNDAVAQINLSDINLRVSLQSRNVRKKLISNDVQSHTSDSHTVSNGPTCAQCRMVPKKSRSS